jgi:hypothetical protein
MKARRPATAHRNIPNHLQKQPHPTFTATESQRHGRKHKTKQKEGKPEGIHGKKSNGHTTALGTQEAWLLKEGIVPNGMPNSKTSCINHVHVR